MKCIFEYDRIRRHFLLPVLFSLSVFSFQTVLPAQISAEESVITFPKSYRGLLDGFYVELVVDWLPDKRVEGEIWTAAHTVTPRELGFVFAKVRGENQRTGELELEILGDEVSGKNVSAAGRSLGVAFLKKKLTGDYIEWSGEYRRASGENAPMMIYRKRTYPAEPEKSDNGKEEREKSPVERERSGVGSCEDGVCDPVMLDVCIEKKHTGEAREYFSWLKFPAAPLCPQAAAECVSGADCAGELWMLEVDGFSEPYWEQELGNLPFIVSARRSTRETVKDTGVVEMTIPSFFSDTVPDNEDAVQKITNFVHDYFSEAVAAGNVSITLKERTKFNYIIDILGASPSLSLQRPGIWEHHQLSIMMSQPYPYSHPDTFAIYIGLLTSRYSEWSKIEPPPSDTILNITENSPSVFLEKLVSAFAQTYRAAEWTP